MIVDVEHLRKDKDSGVYIYRRKFPVHLRAFIPSGSPTGRGRVEFKVSLQCKSMNAPGASARLQAARDDYASAVEAAELRRASALKRSTGAFDVLDQPTIAYLAEQYRVEALASDQATRNDPDAKARAALVTDIARKVGHELPLVPESAKWTQSIRLAHSTMREAAREMRAHGDTEGIEGAWGELALSMASERGFEIGMGSSSYRALCAAINDAAATAHEEALKRLDGDLIPTPMMPEPPRRAQEAPRDTNPPATLQAVAEGLLGSKASPVGHSTASSWSAALRFFKEVHGTPTPDQITRLMVTEWIELLAQRPAMLPKTDRGLALRPLVAKYAPQDVEVLSKKTVRGHLAALATIFNKGQEQGIIAEHLANPFKARKSLSGSGEDEEGTEFSMDELHAIFSLPVFTSGDRPTQGRGHAGYWMPLILLWTGARPEEAAQLLVTDFFQDEDTGAWWMAITDEGDHPVKGKRSLKSSRRRFPVPQALLKLGLVSYLNHLRSAKEIAFFPELTIQSKEKGYLTPSVGKWWGQYLKDQAVILVPEKGKRRRPYRDFRTTWSTAARHSRVPEEAMSYLMGHSNTGAPMTRRYGSKDAHATRMMEVDFPKLDLSRVKPWSFDRC